MVSSGWCGSAIAEGASPEGITFIGFRRTWGNAGSRGAEAFVDPLPAPMREALEGAGLGPIRGVEWSDLTAEDLSDTRVAVVMIWPHRMTLAPHDKAVVQLLKDYAEAGGGVLFSADRQQQLKDHFIPMALAEAFGTELLIEELHINPKMKWKIGDWDPDTFTYTDRVFPPINEGVDGVLYQAVTDHAYRSVVPFVAKVPWKVVLDSGNNAWTEPVKPLGLEAIDRFRRDEGFESNIPLVGIRDFGKGRVAYFGINMPNIVVRAVDSPKDLEVYTAYTRDGYGGYPSDMLKLYANLLGYLGGNADQLADATLAMEVDDLDVEFDTGWTMHRGVIGPRTTYSSGTATPAEWVDKAKSLGLDYIVFLEEFAAMDRSDFDKLREECEALTTHNFMAVAGISWINEHGNHQYAFSNQLLMPSSALVDEEGGHILGAEQFDDGIRELRWIYELNSFENQSGWYNFKENPYPFYDARNVASMGVVTQHGSEMVERVVEDWADSNFHDQSLAPLAINLATSPDQLDGIATGDVYVNVVGSTGYAKLIEFFNTIASRSRYNLYPPSGNDVPYGAQSITTGPVIDLEMPRGDVSTDDGLIYSRALQSWPMKLEVSSDVGLREVRLMDGREMVRRFLPNGEKTFRFETSVTKEFQHHYWVYATDIDGGEAIGRSVSSQAWLMREVLCTDRNNKLFTVMSLRDDGTRYMQGYSGTTATPDKGPWNPKVRPVGAFMFDEKLGLGSMKYDGAPEGEPMFWFAPEVWWDGQEPEGKGWLRDVVAARQGPPHNRPSRIVASADVLVGDMVMEKNFAPTSEDPLPVYHMWATLRPVVDPTVVKATMRKTYYLPKVDGITAYLVEQDFELLQDVPVGKGKQWAIQLGDLGRSARVTQTARKLGDAPLDLSDTGGSFSFEKGDYVGFYGDPFGSLVVYNLGEPLLLEGGAKTYKVRIPADGDVIPKGSRFSVRLLGVGMHNHTEDPVTLSEDIKQAYGLGVDGTGYQLDLTTGRMLDDEYILSLYAGEKGAVRGSITGLDSMPGNLGAKIEGLVPIWSACLVRGGDDPDMRFIPVTPDGVGRAVLQDDLDSKPLFIGHPYTASDRRAVLALARSAKGDHWQLEVHNPTDEPMELTVSSAVGLPLPKLQQSFQLGPGSSQIMDLGEALP